MQLSRKTIPIDLKFDVGIEYTIEHQGKIYFVKIFERKMSFLAQIINKNPCYSFLKPSNLIKFEKT